MIEDKTTDASAGGKSVFKKIISRFYNKPQSEGEKILAQHEAKKFLDKKLVLAMAAKTKDKLPSWRQLKQLYRFLSPKENKIIKFSFFLIFLAGIVLVVNFWFFTLKSVPAHGGEYSEGLVGSPQYLNPVLAAANDVDLDVTSLIFASLIKRGQSGLENDLASSYSISEDQKEYTFTLNQEVKWQGNNELVTADDVLFTFDLIKDPEVGSPLAVSFKGVTAEKIDDYTLKFVLQEPFTPFLSTLTFGILPKYLWEDIQPANVKLAELNLKPIGAGPFAFDSLKKDKQGNIKTLTLKANQDYYGGQPYLDKVTFKFYPDFVSLEQALLNKNVMGVSYLPQDSQARIFGSSKSAKGFNLYSLDLPQYTAIFFNQNNSESLKEKSVRQALYQAIDRQLIVRKALPAGAEVVNSPILKGFIGYDPNLKAYDYAPQEATALLDAAKWQAITPNDYISLRRAAEQKAVTAATGTAAANPAGQTQTVEPESAPTDLYYLAEIKGQEYLRKKNGKILEITLTVVEQPESLAVAEIIKQNWQAIGVKTNINVIPSAGILRDVIRPRHYEALLYSEIVGSDPDPYPFWHSSQNSGSGLNLAVFTDKRVDRYIEAARQTIDAKVREENYKSFQEILVAEVPAIFLYNPTYSYAVDSNVKGLSDQRIYVPSDRLSDMARRYIKTRRSW